MSKQKTNKRSTREGAGASTDKQLRELDAELSRRLDATLGAHAKFELEAMRALARLAPLEEESSSSREEAARPGERQDTVQSLAGDAKTTHSTGADGPSAEVLAKVVFKDGDAFHFLGVPADGEIGVAYIGKGQRWLAAISELPSPLRLYVSLAPPDAPLPWLLAAIDKQKDRLPLVGERRLCDRVSETLDAESETLRLRVPGLPGGLWTPDDFTIGGFCGWNGENEWNSEFCNAELEPGPLVEPNIYKCTAQLSIEVTHNSTSGGHWEAAQMLDCDRGRLR